MTTSGIPFIPDIEISDSIPRVMYQTWETKELPAGMLEAVTNLKDTNPTFEHKLYDNTDRRNFIKTFFPNDLVYAYDTLIPGAYRADLWRYCILYIYGGVYVDIKYIPANGFCFESIISQEQLCRDKQEHIRNGVYNAIMILKSGNLYLKEAIRRIYWNCVSKHYGKNNCAVTGPELLSEIVPSNCKNYSMQYDHPDKVLMNGQIILQSYPTYRAYTKEFYEKENLDYYPKMWAERKVFRENIKFDRIKFEYGYGESFIDCTDTVLQTCVKLMPSGERNVIIPGKDTERDKLFSDPCPGFHKIIKVTLMYNDTKPIYLPI